MLRERSAALVTVGAWRVGVTGCSILSPFGRLDARLAASFYRHRSNLSLGGP